MPFSSIWICTHKLPVHHDPARADRPPLSSRERTLSFLRSTAEYTQDGRARPRVKVVATPLETSRTAAYAQIIIHNGQRRLAGGRAVNGAVRRCTQEPSALNVRPHQILDGSPALAQKQKVLTIFVLSRRVGGSVLYR
jgi:hypothetical protein